MSGTLGAISAALRTIHQPAGNIQCGARATLTVQHSDSRTREKSLYCTKPNGHPADEGHRDGICCWRSHPFSDEVVETREPRDLRRCRKCSDRWPCETIQVLIREGA